MTQHYLNFDSIGNKTKIKEPLLTATCRVWGDPHATYCDNMRQHLTRQKRPGTSWNWHPGVQWPLPPQNCAQLVGHFTRKARGKRHHYVQLNVELANAKSMATLTAPVKTSLELWPSCGQSMPFTGKTPHQCRQNLVFKMSSGGSANS